MPRAKKVKQDAAFTKLDSNQNVKDDVLLEDDDVVSLSEDKFDRLHDGLMMMPSGGALRIRPSGHGPDSDEYASYFD